MIFFTPSPAWRDRIKSVTNSRWAASSVSAIHRPKLIEFERLAVLPDPRVIVKNTGPFDVSFISKAITAIGIASRTRSEEREHDVEDTLVNVEKRVLVVLRHLDDRNAEIFFEQHLFRNDVVKLGNETHIRTRRLRLVDDLKQGCVT